MSSEYILTIDQGTTGTTSALYNRQGFMIGKAYSEITQIYPRSGWVEHDPWEIWESVKKTCTEILAAHPGQVVALGITNQRETTIIWEKKNGRPIHNAIVWQCRRTASICGQLKQHEPLFRIKTGLPVDAYFSGSKIKWLLDKYPDFSSDDLLFGTVDTWLIWQLTRGKIHATDYTNASRTLIFNLQDKKWDNELCNILDIPPVILPEVKNSMDDFGRVETPSCLQGIPILGVAGDQQAALFGHAGFLRGDVKNTYGTGCFLLMNTGDKAIFSRHGLITTLAVDGRGEPCYALEGSIFIGGAAIQWLRDELNILETANQSETVALSVADNGGVYLVPAFVGLGAPHWDMQARGTLTGLTRGVKRAHIVRAALESMAFQTFDVLTAMELDAGLEVEKLAVDGGAVTNNFLLQFQAGVVNRKVVCPKVIETTSLGAAYLAGLRSGFWCDVRELIKIRAVEREFSPGMDNNEREVLLSGWQRAVRQTLAK